MTPYQLDWLTFSLPQPVLTSFISTVYSKTSQLLFKKEEENPALTPPLFRLTDLLAIHPHKELRKIASAFDKRIWFTNNFLPRHTSYFLEKPVEVGELGQRNLHSVLIHMEETNHEQKILSAGCLSIKDSSVWRKKLSARTPSSDSPLKVFLYNVTLRTVEAGDQIDLDRLRENPDFIENIECPLKFINGEVFYPRDHLKPLMNWMKRNGAKLMEKGFQIVHDKRGIKSIPGSVMGSVFQMLNKG